MSVKCTFIMSCLCRHLSALIRQQKVFQQLNISTLTKEWQFYFIFDKIMLIL